jgi:mannitol-specific phosphotransferase system IIBC component
MTNTVNSSDVKTIIFACEAGMGSSLMSVNSLKKKFKKAKIEGIKVIHKPAREIPSDAQLIVIHEGLAKVAISKAPDAVVLAFKQFLNDRVFDKLVTAFSNEEDLSSNVE